MVVVVDTCSLLRLVDYYLPLDKSDKLFPLFEQLFLSRDIVMTRAVFEECLHVSKGIVVNSLPFLNSAQGKRLIVFPEAFAPDQKLLRIVDEHFTISAKFNSLKPEEQEAQKDSFLHSGDFSILQCVYMEKKGMAGNLFRDDLRVLTDESSAENDSKCYKKIPSCCKILGAPTINIREYLEIITDGRIELIIR